MVPSMDCHICLPSVCVTSSTRQKYTDWSSLRRSEIWREPVFAGFLQFRESRFLKCSWTNRGVVL